MTMPQGQPPFPPKSAVDAGTADKSRPLGRGEYARSDTADPSSSRKIVEPMQMGKRQGAYTSTYPGPGPDENVSLNRMGTPTVTNHTNKSYRMADGGVVPDDEEGALSGMVPKSLHKLWGMIPSAADVAVTGKLAATPEEYDKARAAKDAAISRRSK